MATFRPKEVFQLARRAEEQGKTQEAATHYASLSVYLRRRGKVDEALTLVRRAVALVPQYSRLHLHLAICAELKGLTAEADLAMERFSAIAMEKQKVEKYRPLVESSLQAHPRLKQKFFEAVLALDRTGASAFLGRARSLREQGKADLALEVLLDALQTGTEKPAVLEQIEDLLRTQARSEGLIHLGRFREGKISTENFVVLLSESGHREVVPQNEPHEKPLRHLIEELEKEIGVEIDTPQKEIAPLLQEFRKRSQAVLGKDAQARMDMAVAYFEMGLAKEAEEELKEIEETHLLYGQAQVLQGEVFLSQGSELAALDCFQKGLRCPHSSFEVQREARYQLVQVFFRLGDLRQALSHAAELEKVAPDYRGLRWLKNQIQEALENQTGRSA